MATPSPSAPPPPRLYRWTDPPVIGLALVAAAAGFGQFGAVAALADVAATFGEVGEGDDLTLAEQAGLSGTVLGLGLAIIRLSSLLSLPLAGSADHLGRRRTLTVFASLGLLVVALSSLSPGYWWFVLLFAASRPLLTAANAVALTSAAEQTSSADRSRAVALLAAGFGVGAGTFAVVRGLLGDDVSFRPVFALALVALGIVALAHRIVVEPDRYRRLDTTGEPPPRLGLVPRRHLPRLGPVLVVGFSIAVVTGPANSFVFLYSESVLDLSTSITAALVVAAGSTGLLGLLAGRWGADHLGRRPTAAVGLVGVCAAGVLTYSGSVPALAAGYLLAVASGSVFAPAAGSLHAELFPTSIRATVAGWTVAAGVLGAVTGLLLFGFTADRLDRFDLAAAIVFLPAALAAITLVRLPETRGLELETSAPG